MIDGNGPTASLRIFFLGCPIQTGLFDVLLQMTSRHDPDWSSRVRPLIRTRLKNGLLRVARVAQTWAGPGIGKPCDACTSVIERADTEFEVVFTDGRTLRLHFGCHKVWKQELQCES